MQETGPGWLYGPFTEDNVIAACESERADFVTLRFEDGRAVEFPQRLIPPLLTALGLSDVAALPNTPVRVRSIPAAGYVEVDPDVFIGPIPAGESMQFGIRQLDPLIP
ncbi:MAG TPA: hypothetical protein VNJ04_17725 [Gemmatimonadaceae bacterium]|nr:hypothetical protein [Gemmatimonadaceae bacterium]